MFSAINLASPSGLLTSAILKKSVPLVIFLRSFLILSIPAPFLPIATPGLAV